MASLAIDRAKAFKKLNDALCIMTGKTMIHGPISQAMTIQWSNEVNDLIQEYESLFSFTDMQHFLINGKLDLVFQSYPHLRPATN
jgi:hypothetical protein